MRLHIFPAIMLAVLPLSSAFPVEEVFKKPEPPPGLAESQSGAPLQPATNLLFSVRGAGDVSAGGISRKGDRIWIGFESGEVRMYVTSAVGTPLNTQKNLKDGPSHILCDDTMTVIGDGCFSDNPSACGNISIWSPDGHMLRMWKSGGMRIMSLAISPNGKLIATSGHENVRLWQTTDGKLIRELSEPNDGIPMIVSTLQFINDKRLCGIRDRSWISGIDGDKSAQITVWDVASGRAQDIGPRYQQGIVAMALSAHGKHCAVSLSDGTIDVYLVAKNQRLAQLKGHPLGAPKMAFSPDGTLLASGSHWGDQRIWNIKQGKQIAYLQGLNGTALDMQFAPDGSALRSLECHEDTPLEEEIRYCTFNLSGIAP